MKAKSKSDTAADKAEESLTEKRARWEGFEFRVPSAGIVRVENVSYGEESDDHVSVVNVEAGRATGCSCEGFEYHDGPCKHQLAVENTLAVRVAAPPNIEVAQ